MAGFYNKKLSDEVNEQKPKNPKGVAKKAYNIWQILQVREALADYVYCFVW